MKKKLTKVVTSIAIAASMTMTMVPAVSAADYGTATYDTIDTTKTGSLTVHKYDITAATKAGVDTSVFNNDGKSDTKAETDLQKYSIPGVVFSYLKVADIYTESKTTANGIGVRVLYGFNDTNLIGDLGLDTASAELTKNSTYYYTSTEINDALKDKLENSNTATKNTLEDYIKANGGKDMTETSSTGVTSVDKLPVGLYMVVETYVPEDVTYTTDPFMVSIPSTTVDGQNWMYDINVYPKNQTDYPTLDKKVADDDDYSSEGNNGHALKDTASVSEGDIADYRITSKLPAIISKASYFTKYTFTDTLAKGLTYNKDSVTLYWYDTKANADINDTAKAVATWTQDKNKFTVTVQDNKMTVAMTEDGLSEINPNYAGKYVVVSYSTNVKSTDDLVLGDNGNANDVVLTYARTNTTYEDVLKEAQDLGYAERNPEADVEGYDTCRKIAILTSLAFGSTVKFEEIQTEGITKISTADFAYAEKLGCVVKLLATSFKKDEKVYAITAPFLIDATHPLYNVNDVLNGIYIHGNVIGDVMFFGAGAGKLPTASAVVADVVDCVKHKGRNVMTLWSYEKLELGSAMEVERTFFVRIKDRAALEKAKEAFHAVQTVTVDGLDDEFGLVTANMTEQAFAQAAAQFDVAGRIRFDKTTI